MWTRIKRYFTLPVFPDEEKTRVARLLVTILIGTSLTTMMALGFVLASYGPPKGLAEAAVFVVWGLICVFAVASYGLVRRGYATVLAAGFILLMWLAATYWIWAIEGLGAGYTPYAYLLIIVMAGLLLGASGTLVFTLLSLVAVGVSYYLEYTGRFSGQVLIEPFDFIILVAVLGLIGVFLRYAMRSMQDAIVRARRAAQAQAEANRELEAIRVSLEQRVAERTQELESRSILLEAVAHLGHRAAALRDLDELSHRVPLLISERLVLEQVGIFLLDDTNTRLMLLGASSPALQPLLQQSFDLTDDSLGVVGVALARRQTCLTTATGDQPPFFASTLLARPGAELVLPLIAGDRLIGALDLHSADSAFFTEQMVSVLELLADQVAIAIENARLFAQRQASLEAERRAYGEVGREAWEEIARIEGTLRFVIDEQDVLRPAEGEKHPALLQAHQSGRRVTVADNTIAVPIQIREGVNIGAIRLHKPVWHEDEITLVETLAEQLGAALESARLYQETQRREVRERLTREITEDIRRFVDVQMILQSAVTNLGEVLGVPRAYVRLMLEDKDLPAAAYAEPDITLEPSPPMNSPAQGVDRESGGGHHES